MFYVLAQKIGEWFDVITGVKQGCLLSSLIVCMAREWSKAGMYVYSHLLDSVWRGSEFSKESLQLIQQASNGFIALCDPHGRDQGRLSKGTLPIN